jgi:hypothetical protein
LSAHRRSRDGNATAAPSRRERTVDGRPSSRFRFYVRFSERQKSTALEQFTHHYVANTAPGRRRCRDNNDQPGNDGNDVARHRFIVGTNRFGMISPQVVSRQSSWASGVDCQGVQRGQLQPLFSSTFQRDLNHIPGLNPAKIEPG